MNELYVEKLMKLINAGIISADDIKDPEYKAEVQRRLITP